MARVLYTQYIDGVRDDEPREVAPPVEGDDPPTILNRKAQGAIDKGWQVAWGPTGRSFTATKRFESAAAYQEKVRVFEIVED